MKLYAISALAATACAGPLLAARDSVTAVVDLSNNTGTPKHYGSGLLYGVPVAKDQIPKHFYTDIGFNYLRAGGAQIPAPGRGWIWNEYKNRFATVLADYRTAAEYGAPFILLIHDLWGADGTQNSSAPYPGDNGSWAYWDAYLNQLASDLTANSMTTNLIIDIWNEPDLGTVFWGRNQTQYLQMWGHTYNFFRAKFGTKVLLSGPAASSEPIPGNTWWENYLSFVSQNKTIPDQWAWHMESGGGDMLSAYGGLVQLLKKYSLPMKQVNINEYAVYNEQVPAGSAWWISQLERVNAIGLRGNWLSGYQLHDFMASLLSKPNANTNSYSPTAAGYFPNGDFQLYKYYNQNMTGHRVGSIPSGDNMLDVYGTVDTSNKARLLVGVRLKQGTWQLQVNKLSAIGLPTSGTLNIQTWGFPVGSDAHYSEVDGPQNLGIYGHTYSGDTVTFPIYNDDTNRAYAFEFSATS